MRKKLITLVIVALIAFGAFGAFGACHFVTRNEMRDLRQVVAIVHNHNNLDEYQNIYKFELIQAINQQMQGQQFVVTEGFVNAVLDNLIDTQIFNFEIDQMFADGTLVWRGGRPENYGQRRQVEIFDGTNWIMQNAYDIDGTPLYYEIDYTDINELRRAIYDSVDNALRAEQRRIIVERGGEAHDDDDQQAPPEPTPEFPIRTPEVNNDTQPETTLFVPDISRAPGGMGGTTARISLENEALRRFINRLVRDVENHVRVADETRLTADRNKIAYYFSRANYQGLYLALADMYVVDFMAGEQIKRQIQHQILNTHETDGVTVSDADVVARFNDRRDRQITQFRANPGAYSQAVSANNPIMYHANGNYFHVKHVLLPFTDEQTDRLSAYRARQGATPASIAQFRDVLLVNEISVFARREDGFNDYSRTFTAHEVLDLITSEVNSRSANLREADRRFTDFIYMFNTDPGAFTHHIGYAMPTDANTPSGMVPEFENGARELLENFAPGMVLPRFATSDFGVHIMYFSLRPIAGFVAQIHDFETPGEHRTFFEAFYQEIRQEREGTRLQLWAQGVSISARNNEYLIETFPRTFRDLFDE